MVVHPSTHGFCFTEQFNPTAQAHISNVFAVNHGKHQDGTVWTRIAKGLQCLHPLGIRQIQIQQQQIDMLVQRQLL